ncbi:MAG: DUF2855 family protein [Burkholderiaceae bacterium]|nr:DUF2855 family protein [Burkholderiaceae bacterium]
MEITTLLTSQRDPAEGRLQAAPAPALQPGSVRLAVRRVSITTNNVTYALFGERMSYWQFFPSGQEGWGVVPVWGFADVVESTLPEVAVGTRYYGYWPLADAVDLQPTKVSAGGFTDGAAHRAPLPSTYNRYSAAPSNQPADTEGALAIMRPLFGTAFLLTEFLQDNDWFGARQLVLSSASSKTAYATAWCVRELLGGGQGPAVRTIGLTSRANADFVRRLGLYDSVLGYDEIARIDHALPTVFCDFSGSAEQREQLHRHLGDALRHSAVIGATQFSTGARDAPLPGAKPTFFFAPDRRRKRLEDWGPALLLQRVEDSQSRFLQQVLSGPAPALRIVTHKGLAAARDVMAELARGRIDPAVGHVIDLS